MKTTLIICYAVVCLHWAFAFLSVDSSSAGAQGVKGGTSDGPDLTDMGMDKDLTDTGMDKDLTDMGMDKYLTDMGMDKYLTDMGMDKDLAERLFGEDLKSNPEEFRSKRGLDTLGYSSFATMLPDRMTFKIRPPDQCD